MRLDSGRNARVSLRLGSTSQIFHVMVLRCERACSRLVSVTREGHGRVRGDTDLGRFFWGPVHRYRAVAAQTPGSQTPEVSGSPVGTTLDRHAVPLNRLHHTKREGHTTTQHNTTPVLGVTGSDDSDRGPSMCGCRSLQHCPRCSTTARKK